MIHTEDEATIKVASKKNPAAGKVKMGSFKLKQKLPKIKDKDLAAWQEKFEDGECAQYVASLFPSPSYLPMFHTTTNGI